MISLSALLCLLCLCSVCVCATNCGHRQTEINGRCCDLCPPGKYMKAYCSEHHPTVCIHCEKGYYSDDYQLFDRCKECHVCHSEYDRKCMATADAKCSCRPGFLCSDHLCSECEEERTCESGDKMRRTGLREYTYTCEPACPNDTYLDTREDVCKPLTQCSRLPVLFPGNKTHDSICQISAPGTQSIDPSIHMLPTSVLVLFTVSLLLALSLAGVLIYRRHSTKSRQHPSETVAVQVFELQLSTEESGMQLLQRELKDNNSVLQLRSV